MFSPKFVSSDPNVRLLRVGEALTPDNGNWRESWESNPRWWNWDSLSRDVLAAAYRRADFLVHTAEAEGFGLPLIEAMACGCPVIASDLPVLREVGEAQPPIARWEISMVWKNACAGGGDRKSRYSTAKSVSRTPRVSPGPKMPRAPRESTNKLLTEPLP